GGAIGAGFVGSGISAVLQGGTIEAVGDQFFLIPSTGETNSYSFSDSVFLLSYGTAARRWWPNDWTKDLYIGGNLKFFLVNLAGPGVSGGDARGNELDLGLLYAPENYYSLGLNLQNVLPFDFGGKLVYGTGNQEAVPAVIKVGSRFHLLGKKRALWRNDHELDLLLDYDSSFRAIPGLLHAGVEWRPHPLFAIRTGIDQEMVGSESGQLLPYNNMTAGVGLVYRDFRFDYAYHQYQVFRENDTHYFSLSYLPKTEIKEKIRVLTPSDKSIVYEEKMLLTGLVLDRVSIKKLLVGGVNTAFAKDGKFGREIFPRPAKNKIMVEGQDEDGLTLEAHPVRLLRLKAFPDVPAGYWVKRPIEFLALLGIIGGYPDGTFKPEGNITRAEMCALLMRTRPATARLFKVGFKDVAARHWAAGYIGRAADEGVVKGYPGNKFIPNGNITRAEGVAIIVRFAGITQEASRLEKPFADVPGRHWAISEINGARSAGLLDYLEGKAFEPNKKLTRAEAAEMLAKTAGVKKQIDDLLDWERY
ncbi:MAG: S-layer homology domain-containing protein, partial [Candidatus Margulisbacteria bacterium]|nr:S-layer homology domain-containing protein [Candidatus Margulisiibacteriota bacterium]